MKLYRQNSSEADKSFSIPEAVNEVCGQSWGHGIENKVSDATRNIERLAAMLGSLIETLYSNGKLSDPEVLSLLPNFAAQPLSEE